MLDVSKIRNGEAPGSRNLLTSLIAGLADHEHAVAMVCAGTEEMAKKGDFLFITKNGQVKRTTAAEIRNPPRARPAAINLKGEDELVGMVQVDPTTKDDIILITRLGTALPLLDTVSLQGARRRVFGHGRGQGRRGAGLKSRRRAMLLVLSDRASASGCSATMWSGRAAQGKGRSLPMNKTGETGTQLAACLNVTGAKSARVEQRQMTVLNMDEIAVERRTSKGNCSSMCCLTMWWNTPH